MQPRSATSSSIAEDRLWTVDDVSYYLCVPVQTLYWWRVEGLGPRGMRLGRHLRYRPEDVKAWAALQAEAS